jgi:hypothetical protein
MNRRTGFLLRWLLAATGGALLAVSTLLLFYLTGGLTAVAPPVILAGAKLQLVGGRGGPTPAGLEIRETGPQGWAMVRGSVRMVQATVYRRVSWQVDGLPSAGELRLVWATLANPQTWREKALPPAGPEGGMLALDAEPEWRGRIAVIGLAVRGPLSQPLLVRYLGLQPEALTAGALLRELVADWTAFEDWSQRSINYTAGAPANALFPPVVVVALWIGFGAALHALFDPPRRTPGALLPYIALFLLGWLVLDLRWQWDLRQRLERTAASFAGKNEEERRLAALDGEFYRFLQEVRRHLPEQPVRLLIVTADPSGFWAGRARYHLLPHNGYAGFARLPPRGRVRAGDHLLILLPFNDIRYDAERGVLQGQGVQLPVEMLHATAAGALFRVGKE